MGCSNNCTAWQVGEGQIYHADPDVAGPGILTVFIASSALALLLALVHLCLTPSLTPNDNIVDFWVPELCPLIIEFLTEPTSAARRLKRLKDGMPHSSRKTTKRQDLSARVIEKVILNLSDQLLLTGLAVLIAGFWTHCSISVYHFALASDLAWFASNVHLITLAVLWRYLRDRPVLRDWRALLMASMAIFLVASTILQGHQGWYSSWPYDAQCIFDNFALAAIGGGPARWMYANLVLILISYPPNILLLYQGPSDLCTQWLYTEPRQAMQTIAKSLRKERPSITTESPRITKCKRAFYSILIAVIEGCHSGWAFAYILVETFNVSRWINWLFCLAWFGLGIASVLKDKNIPRTEMDGNENAMTFGQIVPILVLGSTIFVAREAYEDVKIEMAKEDLSIGGTSTSSLINSRVTATPASHVGQSFEMSGALQDSDDDTSHLPASLRRVDTEMGGRSQASGLEGRGNRVEPQRRSTFPHKSSIDLRVT
ncbi:hypothetical protein N7G274_010150 [Stereocaulon virgatum]|uniref:Uncharacterized protein n=1 Tax=Stereocaulon virgatum TaxID=373712 RepID=A0ABR3ZUA4_9LECA